MRPTLPRAPTAPRRAWLSRSPHDAPGERPSSTPRTALTAAPRSVLRHPAAQLARAHPETDSRAAAPHHVRPWLSVRRPHAPYPNPSRYPVHTANSQHTRSSTRPVPPSRVAISNHRVAPRPLPRPSLGSSRAVLRGEMLPRPLLDLSRAVLRGEMVLTSITRITYYPRRA